jgi:hypothetical protein
MSPNESRSHSSSPLGPTQPFTQPSSTNPQKNKSDLEWPEGATELLDTFCKGYAAEQQLMEERREGNQKGTKGALRKWCLQHPVPAYASHFKVTHRPRLGTSKYYPLSYFFF